ncbi:MAG: DegT/DnrJ/EryC1/StrS family aminotransferase [Saprospiraceae bacterium]|nr:DegT/DnrJ/EryC1/StrS family aminotransferase [Saprospiraceae bacterium]
MKYPIYLPDITEHEKKLVNDCLDSTWISSRGEYIEQFEEIVADYVGTKHAVAVSNGTVALHLALLAHGIGSGDEVLVPDLTYIATANAVLYVNATPVFVDVEQKSWNISCDDIIKKITSKTKAIIVTDIYGTPPEMDEINRIAALNNLIIIEDAAESLGAEYKLLKAGNLGQIGTLSFFGNKTITTGEGGMVLTNDANTNYLLRKLRNQGNSDSVRYFHDILGYNYRMTNIQAAIGVAQMSRIEWILEKKKNIQKWYKERLKNLVDFQIINEGIVSSYWMVSFLLKDEEQRNNLMKLIGKEGIETRPFFKPISSMPFYTIEKNEVSYNLSTRGVNLPSYPALDEDDIEQICTKIKGIILKK